MMFENLTTGQLFAMRRAVVWWTGLLVWPWEHVFERIDDALEAKGHRVRTFETEEEEQ
jgi:hypothetical protein